MNFSRALWMTLIVSFQLIVHVTSMDPKFDPTTRMRLVLVPSDAAVGSVIYRLRATDEEFDYPLTFELIGDASSSTVQIDSLPCTKYNSVCQANVVLRRRLEPGRYYDFQVSVKDTKGGMAMQSCSLTATNFSTPHDTIFPHKPGIIMIAEDAKRGTELDYVISRKNSLSPKPVYLELWGSPLFAIRQKSVSDELTEGTIFLLGPLDFEKQAMYHLTVLANDAYGETNQDTRNIAGLEVVVIVQDVQDMPPIFTLAPPVTRLPSGLLPGDKILQVHAEDGDKGSPRDIRYGLVSEGNPFTSFFEINDTSGEIFLLRPLDEISAITHVGDPVLLTIVAEEVKVMRDEPASMASTVQVAFLLPERSNSPPYFENDQYVARCDENSPPGTTLIFPDPYIALVSDDDAGKNGVFSLTLLGNNGTFEISPNVAERRANFLIRVRDNSMIDYEMFKSLQFQILAQELGPATNLSAIANVTIYIDDVNDNPPAFTDIMYVVELPENMTAGTRVTQIHAEDVDTGMGGKVRYTQILGYLNTSLNLDPITGMIIISTENHGFDREQMPEYHFYVEARDNEGNGNRAQVPLVIKLIDVNDEAPVFEKSLYEFILSPDLRNFTVPAFIRATDADAEPPNNVVRYELLQGNYENKFNLHSVTGELTLREPLNQKSQRNVRRRRQSSDDEMKMIVMTARAFDLGVPVQWSTTTIKVYPPESRLRTVMFIVPGANPTKRETEETLSELTGARVSVLDIRPYTGNEPGATDFGGNSKERSVATATILYDSNSIVDVEKIQQKIASRSGTSSGITSQDEETAASVYRAENKILFWLLIFLAILIALIILALLFCCICSWCPFYAGARKRVVRVNSTGDDVHLVHTTEQGIGKQTKSVQVAEWMGRREAWSAEKSASDPRTKPTRWEFSRRNANRQKLADDAESTPPSIDDDNNSASGKDIRLTSGEAGGKHHRHKKISKRHVKEISTGKDIQLHNSRTNLINDREVYVEDVAEEREYQGARRKVEIDDDSMRRHEMDRGSEIEFRGGGTKRQQQQQQQGEDGPRDQLFIKDGNAEILRLITRGKGEEDGIYVNIPQRQQNVVTTQPQYIMVDNMGKEILMRRYIEEQANGKQIIREHYQVIPNTMQAPTTMPNEIQPSMGEIFMRSQQGSVIYANQLDPNIEAMKMAHSSNQQSATKGSNIIETDMQQATSHQSIIQQELENSLKQQNALLRQILLEKERLEEKYNQHENALETQSLPCHSLQMAVQTQTDCEMGTQTDRIEKRRARSENDDSMSDDDYEYVRYSPQNSPDGVYYLKRKKPKKRSKHRDGTPRRRVVVVESMKRKIRTPIQEENEDTTPPAKKTGNRETKTSILRRQKALESAAALKKRTKSPSLKKDTLLAISNSLDDRKTVPKVKEHRKYIRKTHTEEVYEKSDDDDTTTESDDDDIARDSLEDPSDDEVIIQKNNRKTRRKHVDRGSSTDINHLSPDQEYYHHRKSTRSSKRSIRSDRSASPLPSKSRVSRRDSTKETVIKTKVRRQAESEPPTNRIKGPAPKPPPPIANSRLRRSVRDGTKSEMDLSKKAADEAEGRAAIPKYMQWYYDKEAKREEKVKRTPIKKSNLKKTTAPVPQLKPSDADLRQSNERLDRIKPEPLPRSTTSPAKTPRLLKEDNQTEKSKSHSETDKSHSLLQHSEHRFEHEYPPGADHMPPKSKLPHYLYPETPPQVNRDAKRKSHDVKPKPSPIKEGEVKKGPSKTIITINSATTSHSKQLNASTLEDDHDSGIAMNSLLHSMGRRNPIAEKKSVFTIAYDDVKIKKIRSESDSPNN